MPSKLHRSDIWQRLRELSLSARGAVMVAAPYLGPGASTRLPLKRGDTLVCRCDEHAARTGCVDPREITKYLKRGVRVHAVSNLHAKVFVFPRRVLVGSTNISESSESHL